jgi:putative ABC transport system permease protein
VRVAIPIAVGDNYEGWRIVGTVPQLFTVEYRKGQTYSIAEGGKQFDPAQREAVIGSLASERLGLKVGDTFRPYHGLNFDPNAQHEEVYTITGVLKPTNTPADRVIWIPLQGVQAMGGHDPKMAGDVSAVLIQFRAPTAGMMLDVMYNKQGNRLTLA